MMQAQPPTPSAILRLSAAAGSAITGSHQRSSALDVAAVGDRPAPPLVLLGGSGGRSAPAAHIFAIRGASPQARSQYSAAAYSSPARQLHRDIVETQRTQFDLQNELEAARRDAAMYKQRCVRLEDELLLAYTEFVPPATFLPPSIIEKHRDVVDLLNDYALLYRATKLQLLHDRCGKVLDPVSGEWVAMPDEKGQKGRMLAAMEAREKDAETAYLRDRVTALTAQVQAVQQQLNAVRPLSLSAGAKFM